jgi:acyl-CoA thioesterase-2
LPELNTPVAPLSVDDLLRPVARPGGARGYCHSGAPNRAYGGHLVAQALLAAPADRPVHSAHAYFLSPARPDRPVDYDVTETRVSRSFTTRQVAAHQDDVAVLTLITSSHADEPSVRHDTPNGPLPPPPDDVPTDIRADHPLVRSLHMLTVPDAGDGHHRVWVRTRAPLPTDPAIGPAVLAYMADAILPVASILPLGADPTTVRSASLDFVMWFHRPVTDGWLLFDSTCATFGGARGLSHMRILTPAGDLVASAAQEVLIRL